MEQVVLQNTYFSLSLAHPFVELHERNFASATAEGSWTSHETYMASRSRFTNNVLESAWACSLHKILVQKLF